MDTSNYKPARDIDTEESLLMSTRDMVEVATIQEQVESIESVDELRSLFLQTMEQTSILVNKASLADMAGGVFHNLGNVLNSLNVSILMMEGRLNPNRLDGLKKLSSLIEQTSDESDFFSIHPKGKHIPGYIKKLTGVLVEEAVQTSDDLMEIKQQVTHMKELIRVQQDLLKRRKAESAESILVEQVIDEAVQLTQVMMCDVNIDIISHHEPGVSIFSDRHKILQILVNFISNAKQACEAFSASERKLFIRSWIKDDDHVCIEVQDTGVGISSDDFSKLFSHGFTTKSDGHGFGLHSCKRLSQELGGCIEVESDGVNKGAKFRLLVARNLVEAG